MRKLEPFKKEGEERWSGEWIANPCCDGRGKLERLMIDRRLDLEVIAEIHDKEASYSYDDWALVRLDGEYYLLNTSGCSCPDPCETWRVMKGPVSLRKLKADLLAGEYAGYTVPGKQMAEFIAAIEEEAHRTDSAQGDH